jgi:hypothetical protein
MFTYEVPDRGSDLPKVTQAQAGAAWLLGIFLSVSSSQGQLLLSLSETIQFSLCPQTPGICLKQHSVEIIALGSSWEEH